MRYVSWLRRFIANAAEWLRDDAGPRRKSNPTVNSDQSDDQDDLFYIAFLGPHV